MLRFMKLPTSCFNYEKKRTSKRAEICRMFIEIISRMWSSKCERASRKKREASIALFISAELSSANKAELSSFSL